MIKFSISSEEQQLVLENIRLVYHLAKGLQIPNGEYDDVISVGTIGLIKAVQTFDKSKNIQFATYASRCITNEFYMYFRREKKHANEISLDEPLSVDYDGNELVLSDILPASSKEFTQELEECETFMQIINITLNCFKSKERLVLLYRIANINQRAVAKNLDISQSYVSRIERKCYKKLKNYLTFNKRFVEFFSISMIGNLYRISFVFNDINSFKKLFNENMKSFLSTERDFNIIYSNQQVIIFVPAEFESFSFIADIIKELDKNNLLSMDIPISNSTIVNKGKRQQKKTRKKSALKVTTKTQIEKNIEKVDIVETIETIETVTIVQDTKTISSESYETEIVSKAETNISEKQHSEKVEVESNMEVSENSLNYILPEKDSIVRQIIDYMLTLESFRLKDLKSNFSNCSTLTIKYALRLATENNLIIYKYKGKYCRN